MSEWKRNEEFDKFFPSGTKVYKKGGLVAAVSIENGLYHMSISHKSRYPIYNEIKDARYSLIPDNHYMAQILPPKKEFVNIHENCFHLFELSDNEMRALR